MDPVTAFANVVVALLEYLTEVSRGQSAAQKEKMWDWYIKDIEAWRKLFKIDNP